MTIFRFAGDSVFNWGMALACLLAALAFYLCCLEMRRSNSGAVVSWLLPCLRALAVLLIGLTLAEPMMESRRRVGELGQLVFVLDGSQSMTISEGVDGQPPASRFARAASSMLGNAGLLETLRGQFDIRVVRTGQNSINQLWDSGNLAQSTVPPRADVWFPERWASVSPLGDHLQQILPSAPKSLGATGNLRATATAILLSDGQSNYGSSPLDAADELSQAGVRVFPVGMGPYRELNDLVLQSIVAPPHVFRTDTLQGTIRIAGQGLAGIPATVQLVNGTQVVWQEKFVAAEQESRELNFSLAVDALFVQASQALPEGASYTALPFRLSAQLIVHGGDAISENNARDLFFSIISQKTRLLLVDDRSRWETRYLKNLFARDPAWQMDSVVGHAGDQSLAGLPQSKAELFKYDLVIVGEVAPTRDSLQWMRWLREYVELAGGGVICIDGQRQHLRDERFKELHRMLPVEWSQGGPNISPSEPKPIKLTEVGQQLDAFQLSPHGSSNDEITGSEANAQLWSQLPPIHFVSQVRPLPGSQTLVEAGKRTLQPLMVTRRYGAGRVLFVASDESWRWRYQVADVVHSRLWNQLARWVMKTPMSVNSEFISLDTGPANYASQQTVELRCQLRDADGQPATSRIVMADVYRNHEVVSKVPLAESSVLGSYSAQLQGLAPGDYRVKIDATGFTSQALDLESQFTVAAPESGEMHHIACNEGLLKSIAQRTQGRYFRESETELLIQELQPMATGRIQTSITVLWQSVGWFACGLLLLTVEWLVRKRVGLV